VAVLTVLRNTPVEHPRVNEAERRLIAGEPHCREAPAPVSSQPRNALWQSVSWPSARNMLYFLVQGFCATFADAVFVTWVPYFLREVHGLDYARMGIYSALPLGGGACGGVVGGYLNDFLLRTLPSRRWARSLVGAVGMGMACLLLFAALAVYDNPYAFCLVLMLSKFFSDWGQPTVWGTVTDIAGSNTATVFGLVNGVGGVGALIAPVMLGAVASAYSWTVAFAVVAAAYAIGAAAWLLVNCTIPLFRAPPVTSPSLVEKR
jgi:MFS transporter, ACS family, glucarate transporter